jgi:type IV fimbrial biogenesis protein FimT
MTLRPDLARQSGFTLIEALVVITIMTILAGIGSANFVWLNQATEIRGAAFDLVADLDYARSEAVKRNADVTVAPVGDNWVNGWRVTDAGGATLRERAAVRAGLNFMAAPASLLFDGSGRADLAATRTFVICPPSNGLMGRNVRIDPSGLSRSIKTNCTV